MSAVYTKPSRPYLNDILLQPFQTNLWLAILIIAIIALLNFTSFNFIQNWGNASNNDENDPNGSTFCKIFLIIHFLKVINIYLVFIY